MLVFISYDRVDAEQASTVARILADAGHTPWIDRELVPGQTWKDVLAERIEACDRFVCVVTPDSLASEWCTWELSVANRARKPILPVLYRVGGKAHGLLRTLQFADFTAGPTEAAARALLAGLATAVPGAPDPALPREAPDTVLEQPFYQRHFSDGVIRQQFDLRAAGEQVLAKQSAARLVYGLVQVGGRLTLTDQRLLFEAHDFNVRKQRLEIQLADIASARAIRTMVTPSIFAVATGAGRTHRFFTYNGTRLVELIERYR